MFTIKNKNKKQCKHNKLTPCFDKYIDYLHEEYCFVCEDCGKVFITKDKNFNGKEINNEKDN